jgi:hypothetical protein
LGLHRGENLGKVCVIWVGCRGILLERMERKRASAAAVWRGNMRWFYGPSMGVLLVLVREV